MKSTTVTDKTSVTGAAVVVELVEEEEEVEVEEEQQAVAMAVAATPN